ncbi:MAG: peptide ABC transporter substrate-binding protein [Chlamydiales bacterium]|nr:peptide ABC transporter substrate-binding protein [Chlamydiales bacterium]
MSLIFGIQLDDPAEFLNEDQILSVIEELQAPLDYVKGSLYQYSQPSCPIKKCILDFVITSENGYLSLTEVERIKKQFPVLILERIMTQSPTIFWANNEEENIKNILMLSHELSCESDIPQVIISFERSCRDIITYKSVIVRVINKDNPSSLNIEKNQFSHCGVFLEKTQIVGHFSKDVLKEASILRFDLTLAQQFLNIDRSINLYSIRNYIVSLIEKILGPIRDYNGGLISRQYEALITLKNFSKDSLALSDHLIERFFFNISPVEKQSTIPLAILIEVLILFSVLLESKATHALERIQKDSWTIMIAKGGTLELLQEVKDFHKSDDELDKPTTSYFQCGNHSFVIFLYQNVPQSYLQKLENMIQSSYSKWRKKDQEQSILRLASANLPLSIDPRFAGDELSGTIVKMLFEGLMRYESGQKMGYGVAERVECSLDQTSYTFFLRDCHWSNGDPVTAYDFEYSWKKTLCPTFPTPFAYFFYPIQNAKLCKEGILPSDKLGVKVIDNKTLRVDLTSPFPSFLELTAYSLLAPVHKETDMKFPTWSSDGGHLFVCNGPFKFYDKQQSGLQFIRNPKYWDASSIQLEGIKFSQLPSQLSLNLFNHGQIDWLGPPFHPWDPIFAESERKQDYIHGIHGQYWISCNTKDSILSHSNVRRALSLAINRKALTEVIFSTEDVALSILPKGHTQVEDPTLLEGDPEKARALFNTYLMECGMELRNFPFLHFCIGLGDLRKKVAYSIANQWKEVLGIDCKIEVCEWQDLFTRLRSGNFQLGGIMWKAWINDPSYTLDVFLDEHHPVNFSSWEDKKFKSILLDAQKETHAKDRKKKLKLAEEILLEELPVIPIHIERASYLKNKALENVLFSEVGRVDFKYSFFSKNRKRE